MIGFVLEDAGRPTVQMLLVLFAVFILPAGGDVKPAFAYRLIAVEAQATFVEAAGFGADRLIAWVDDDMEREFGRFTRIIVIVVTYMVFHHGEGQSKTDLGCGKAYARRFDHGDAHGFDEFVERFAAQLAFVGCGLLAQYRFTCLHDGEQLFLAAGFDEFFNLAVEFEVDFRVASKHGFPSRISSGFWIAE